MQRARFNIILDGNIGRLIFKHLNTLWRGCARLVCKDWYALVPKGERWNALAIAHVLTRDYRYFRCFEFLTTHWVFIPDFDTQLWDAMLCDIFVKDNVDAINWLYKRAFSYTQPSFNWSDLALKILRNCVTVPRIYQWLLVHTRYVVRRRRQLFWLALQAIPAERFPDFLNDSIVETSSLDEIFIYDCDDYHNKFALLDEIPGTLRHTELWNKINELTKPEWKVPGAFWEIWVQTIWHICPTDDDVIHHKLSLICEAYGQVPPKFCSRLRESNSRDYKVAHRALKSCCSCPKKPRKKRVKKDEK